MDDKSKLYSQLLLKKEKFQQIYQEIQNHYFTKFSLYLFSILQCRFLFDSKYFISKQDLRYAGLRNPYGKLTKANI